MPSHSSQKAVPSVHDTIKTNDSGSIWRDGPPEYRIGYGVGLTWNKDSVRKTHVDADGWRPMTPYHADRSEWNFVPGEYDSGWIPNGGPNNEKSRYTIKGVEVGNFHWWDIGARAMVHDDISNLIQQSQTECMVRLSEGKVNFGQALAESKATMETLADTASDLWRLLLLAKKGRWSQIPREYGLLKIGPDWYLRWQYGWKPLCQDIYNTYQAFQEGTNRPHLLRAARRVSNAYDAETVEYGRPCVSNAQVSATTIIYATVSSSFLADINAYGLVNPVSLAWELIPYSFVVDWGIPIGNTLQSLSAGAGLDFKGGCTSLVKDGHVSFPGDCGHVIRTQKDFTRQLLTSYPSTVTPYAKANPFSSSHVTSALALSSQLR